MGLKFKIILGYGILIVLLAVTIYLFRSEQVKRNTLLRNERKLVVTWQLTEYCLEHKVSFNKMYQIVREEFPNMSSIPGYRKLTHLGFLYSKVYEEYKNLSLYNRPVKHPFFLVGQAEHSADLLTHPVRVLTDFWIDQLGVDLRGDDGLVPADFLQGFKRHAPAQG